MKSYCNSDSLRSSHWCLSCVRGISGVIFLGMGKFGEEQRVKEGKGAWRSSWGFACYILFTASQWSPIEGGSCVLLSLLKRHGGRGVLGSAINQRFETDEVDNERY